MADASFDAGERGFLAFVIVLSIAVIALGWIIFPKHDASAPAPPPAATPAAK
jgi:hypothetical protein